MIDFKGKQGLITGVANQRSIATFVAQELHRLGATLAFTYGPDTKGRFERFVRKTAKECASDIVLPLDAGSDEDMQACFAELERNWGGLDFLVHSMAYADKSLLEASFSKTGREGWKQAIDISAFSLLPMAKHATPLFLKRGGGSMIAMTFIGSVLAVPNYNVMGAAKAALESSMRYLARELGPQNIRCNCISPGALRTLSSLGISNFSEMHTIAGEHAAMGRNVTQEEVAKASAFMLSDASSGITGQTLYVDCGYNIMAN